jgi:hypothetical protein
MLLRHQPREKILLVVKFSQNRPDKPVLMKPAQGYHKGDDEISHLDKDALECVLLVGLLDGV